MQLLFVKEAWDGYLYWQQNDKRINKRLNELIKAVAREPFSGIGKPDLLKFDMAGYWSRRINNEHRLAYKIDDDTVTIIQCRYHY